MPVGARAPYRDGSRARRRFGNTIQQLVSHGHPWYYELARGRNSYVRDANVSLVGTAPTTASKFTVYNPPNSGILISIVNCSTTVGTFVANAAPSQTYGIIYAASLDPTAVALAPSQAVVNNAHLGTQGVLSKARFYTAVTLPATPVIVRTLCSIARTPAAQDNIWSVIDDVSGAIVLGENTAISIQSIGSSAPQIALIHVSIEWEEIPFK